MIPVVGPRGVVVVGAGQQHPGAAPWELLGGTDEARVLKKTRWALLKNPWNMNDLEEDRLAKLQRAAAAFSIASA